MKEYKNPRLKHVNNIKTICGDISYVIGTPKTFVDMQVESIIHQCNLLLETKKDSVKEDVNFLKDNGFKSLSKALVKLDKETKKAKKRKKKTYYYKITGIHEDGSLSNTPKTGSFKVTKSDQKEECKHESGINNAVCWKCGIYLHSLDNQAPIKGGDSCKRVKSILPDPKEESKKYLWSVADEERLDKKNAPDPKEEMREIEPLSKVVKKDQTDRKFVMCVAEKVEELVERVNILSKSK